VRIVNTWGTNKLKGHTIKLQEHQEPREQAKGTGRQEGTDGGRRGELGGSVDGDIDEV